MDANRSDPDRQTSTLPTRRARRALHDQRATEGRYAGCALVDLNQNQKMDLNLARYLTEAHGFSNEATGRMGSPSFEEAAFEHRGETRITVSVR